MCLTKVGSRRKATKDIVCYKILYEYSNLISEKQYCSPYNEFLWEFGKTYDNKQRGWSYGSKDNIYQGYFHTFEKLYVCQKECEEMKWNATFPWIGGNPVIVKCIIPKGSYYYYGYHQGGLFGYASKQLKIVEKYVPVH